MKRVPHPNDEHLWKWGEAHDDGTYSHGPCVVKGCDREGEARIPEPTDRDARRVALFVERIPAVVGYLR